MAKQLKTLLIASILALGSTGSALAMSLPGIPESGLLTFDFDEARRPATSLRDALRKLTLNRVSLTQPVPGITLFTAINAGHFTFTDLNNTQFDGQNGNFLLNAYFGNDGNFTNGSVVITGTIAGIGIGSLQTLMTADLTGFATADGLVGFATGNIVCNAAFADGCFPNESVYIQTGLSTGTGGLGSLNNFGGVLLSQSLTTVPLPAPVLLLLSAIGAAFGLSRRKRIAQT